VCVCVCVCVSVYLCVYICVLMSEPSYTHPRLEDVAVQLTDTKEDVEKEKRTSTGLKQTIELLRNEIKELNVIPIYYC